MDGTYLLLKYLKAGRLRDLHPHVAVAAKAPCRRLGLTTTPPTATNTGRGDAGTNGPQWPFQIAKVQTEHLQVYAPGNIPQGSPKSHRQLTVPSCDAAGRTQRLSRQLPSSRHSPC